MRYLYTQYGRPMNRSWASARGLKWYEKVLALCVTPLIVMTVMGGLGLMLFVGLCYLVFQIICMILFSRNPRSLR